MITRNAIWWGPLLAAVLTGCQAGGLTPDDDLPGPPEPPDVNLYVALGRMHEAADRDVPAVEAFEKAVEMSPRNVDARVRLGLAYDRVGLRRLAVAQHRKALELAPHSAWLHNNLGYSYMIQNQYALAVEQFEKALTLDPQNARYRNNLAVALSLSGLYQAGLDEFRRAGTELEAQYNLGCVYFYLRRWDRAAACYRRALAADPNCEEAKAWLAKIPTPGTTTQPAGGTPAPTPNPATRPTLPGAVSPASALPDY